MIKSGILQDMTDIHSHILPGVDDGSPDMATSLSLLAYMEKLGIRKAWITPHIMEDYPNTKEKLENTFRQLREEYSGSIQLLLGGEYMLDSGFQARLQQPVLSLNQQLLLVETSYMYAPNGMDSLLLDIHNKGYKPLIAHPERYMYMEAADYQSLKNKGYLFQLNLMSLSGYYGKRPKLVSEDLLQKGWYDYVGSDLHHLERYQPMLDQLTLKKEQLDQLARLIENNSSI